MDKKLRWEEGKKIVTGYWLVSMFLFFFGQRNYICSEWKSHTYIYISALANYGVFSQIKLNLHFPRINFLVANPSEGDSRSESSPVKPVRQFWIKRLYPAWSVALTVDRKIKVNLQSRVSRWTNGYREMLQCCNRKNISKCIAYNKLYNYAFI